jgi:hypothetical protein
MNRHFPRTIIPWRLRKMVRQATSNDDSDINELLTSSLSALFPEVEHSSKLDEHTNHTSDTTRDGLSDDDFSEHQEYFLEKKISFEQDEIGDARVIGIDDDSDESLNFRDVFPEYQPGIDDSFNEMEESFAQIVCDIDVRNLRKEQRKKVIKAFFAPMKSLVTKPVKIPAVKIPRMKKPIQMPEVNFRHKRKRVTFAEAPSYIAQQNIEETISEELTTGGSAGEEEEPVSTWYSEEEYDSMKRGVLRTMEKIVRCHKKKKHFLETEHQTARGLELVTRDMIVDRKVYKLSSRHIVFDLQEEQRVSNTYDPERIRDRYTEATSEARDTALEYGWKDQEAVHKLNEESCCISEE